MADDIIKELFNNDGDYKINIILNNDNVKSSKDLFLIVCDIFMMCVLYVMEKKSKTGTGTGTGFINEDDFYFIKDKLKHAGIIVKKMSFPLDVYEEILKECISSKKSNKIPEDILYRATMSLLSLDELDDNLPINEYTFTTSIDKEFHILYFDLTI